MVKKLLESGTVEIVIEKAQATPSQEESPTDEQQNEETVKFKYSTNYIHT